MYNSHWGGVVENNSFGTHEFLDMCEMLGIEPYVCINVGSGTVQEAMEWVEYMTSDAASPMANLPPGERPRQTLESALCRRRERKLGLRRIHAARVLR